MVCWPRENGSGPCRVSFQLPACHYAFKFQRELTAAYGIQRCPLCHYPHEVAKQPTCQEHVMK
jgi:hypothetical protein